MQTCKWNAKCTTLPVTSQMVGWGNDQQSCSSVPGLEPRAEQLKGHHAHPRTAMEYKTYF